MKGSDKVISVLNLLLADELTAVDQYMVHAAMNANWGYKKLHDYIEKRAIEEMKHAERLIDRILFLEGAPVVSELNPMHIGSKIPEMFDNDHSAEATAIKSYNSAIKIAGEESDFATREILESILTDEDHHIDDIEANQDQIAQMTLPIYLSEQIS